MTTTATDFVQWFRAAAPYIHSHRGKTFVLHFAGELIDSPSFPNLIHDIALLNSLGIRPVVVFGARTQIEQQLKDRKIKRHLVKGLRLTDEPTLNVVKQTVGALRIQIEALFSMGLPNSPMRQAHVPGTRQDRDGQFHYGEPHRHHQRHGPAIYRYCTQGR